MHILRILHRPSNVVDRLGPVLLFFLYYSSSTYWGPQKECVNYVSRIETYSLFYIVAVRITSIWISKFAYLKDYSRVRNITQFNYLFKTLFWNFFISLLVVHAIYTVFVLSNAILFMPQIDTTFFQCVGWEYYSEKIVYGTYCILLLLISTIFLIIGVISQIHILRMRFKNNSIPIYRYVARKSGRRREEEELSMLDILEDLPQSDPYLTASMKPASGLTPNQINRLNIVPLETIEDSSSRECPICLFSFLGEKAICKLPYCAHLFHLLCVKEWFQAKTTCPKCRTPLRFF